MAEPLVTGLLFDLAHVFVPLDRTEGASWRQRDLSIRRHRGFSAKIFFVSVFVIDFWFQRNLSSVTLLFVFPLQILFSLFLLHSFIELVQVNLRYWDFSFHLLLLKNLLVFFHHSLFYIAVLLFYLLNHTFVSLYKRAASFGSIVHRIKTHIVPVWFLSLFYLTNRNRLVVSQQILSIFDLVQSA